MPTVKSFSDIGEKYEKNKKKNCFPIGGNNGFDPAGKFAGLGGIKCSNRSNYSI